MYKGARMYRGFLVLAQNSLKDASDAIPKHELKPEFEGIFVDVWYKELTHIKGQHVYYKQNVYKVQETCPANTEFETSKHLLVVKNVRLFKDQNPRLDYHRATKDDVVLSDNKLYTVIATDDNMPYNITTLDDTHIDVWYADLEYEADQYVWHDNCVYKINTSTSGTKNFADLNTKLVHQDVKLFADSDKDLFCIDPRETANVLYYNKLCILSFAKVHNYVEQACLLASSIKKYYPTANITIITDDNVPEQHKSVFEHVFPIPLGDDAVDSSWKVENRWKLYNASPYDETIVMDADMVVLEDISHWWDYLEKYDLFFTSNVKTYRNKVVKDDAYRKTFTANDLPNIYTGLHYFKKSNTAQDYYSLLKLICKNWEEFYKKFLPNHTPKWLSMDVAGALAVKILGIESQVMTKNSSITFTHMKSLLQNWRDTRSSWMLQVKPYVNDKGDLKIGNYLQHGVFHYTEEEFMDTKGLENLYE